LVVTTSPSACRPSWLWPKRLPRRIRYYLPNVKKATDNDTDHV
jgi:adenosine kinase